MRDLALFAATHYGAPSVDPLAALSDDFAAGSTMTGNGWTIEDSSPSATPSNLITSGAADLTIATGGTGGSFHYDGNDGVIWYKAVSGACELRARVWVENAAGTNLPPTAQYRIGGICAHDPDRTTREYLHIGVGALNAGGHVVEWKTTDNDDSAFDAAASVTLTGGEIRYDLRIVRRATDLQVFDLHVRAGTSEDLDSDTGWTSIVTIDRSDDTSPDRATYGGTSAVELPDELRWGFMLYSNTTTPNIRMHVEECIFSTPSA